VCNVPGDLLVPLPVGEDAEVGGKAANLARLRRMGVAVPDGWVVTLQADRLRRSGELSVDALDALVRDRLLAGDTPADGRYAVRSSADTEDSARASYAGQFRTELNVACADVPAAVRRVADSLHGTSARAYARRLGVRVPDAMAVLVQEQLQPFLSGVCFTAHPVTGAPALVLEYAHGLGDEVAGGGAPAGSYVLPRLPGGGFADARLAEVDPPTARWLRAVSQLCLEVAAAFGAPQDVEWAVDRRGLWLLQARPITTIGRPPTIPESMRSEA
jgi:phosphoenolpyruvate synthase/pyruvate phosphate dikinase